MDRSPLVLTVLLCMSIASCGDPSPDVNSGSSAGITGDKQHPAFACPGPLEGQAHPFDL